MTDSLHKNLTAFLLLLVLLLGPLNSFAHEPASGASSDTCACQLLMDRSSGESGADHSPGESSQDCCDSEECCPDGAVPPVLCDLKVNFSAEQLFLPHTKGYTPQLYFAIFVPPQSFSQNQLKRHH